MSSPQLITTYKTDLSSLFISETAFNDTKIVIIKARTEYFTHITITLISLSSNIVINLSSNIISIYNHTHYDYAFYYIYAKSLRKVL